MALLSSLLPYPHRTITVPSDSTHYTLTHSLNMLSPEGDIHVGLQTVTSCNDTSFCLNNSTRQLLRSWVYTQSGSRPADLDVNDQISVWIPASSQTAIGKRARQAGSLSYYQKR